MKNINEFLNKHDSKILTSVGIIGMFSMTALSIYATPKALVRIEEEKKRRNIDKLSPIDLVKTVGILYVVPISIGVASASCLIGSTYISEKKHVSAATAYAISSTAYAKYREKTKEVIGDKKEEEIRASVSKENVDSKYNNNVYMYSDNTKTLCYDNVSGRFFESDISKIKEARNKLNSRLIDEMYVSLNEFYYDLGVESINIGEELGWHIEDGIVEFDYTSILTEDDRPCLVVDYSIKPKHNYNKCMR